MRTEEKLVYAIEILGNLLPREPTKATINKLIAMVGYDAHIPRPIKSGTIRACDWCGKPRGGDWIISPFVWCWFLPQRKWRNDICIPCFRGIPGVKKWMKDVAPEMLEGSMSAA